MGVSGSSGSASDRWSALAGGFKAAARRLWKGTSSTSQVIDESVQNLEAIVSLKKGEGRIIKNHLRNLMLKVKDHALLTRKFSLAGDIKIGATIARRRIERLVELHVNTSAKEEGRLDKFLKDETLKKTDRAKNIKKIKEGLTNSLILAMECDASEGTPPRDVAKRLGIEDKVPPYFLQDDAGLDRTSLTIDDVMKCELIKFLDEPKGALHSMKSKGLISANVMIVGDAKKDYENALKIDERLTAYINGATAVSKKVTLGALQEASEGFVNAASEHLLGSPKLADTPALLRFMNAVSAAAEGRAAFTEEQLDLLYHSITGEEYQAVPEGLRGVQNTTRRTSIKYASEEIMGYLRAHLLLQDGIAGAVMGSPTRFMQGIKKKLEQELGGRLADEIKSRPKEFDNAVEKLGPRSGRNNHKGWRNSKSTQTLRGALRMNGNPEKDYEAFLRAMWPSLKEQDDLRFVAKGFESQMSNGGDLDCMELTKSTTDPSVVATIFRAYSGRSNAHEAIFASIASKTGPLREAVIEDCMSEKSVIRALIEFQPSQSVLDSTRAELDKFNAKIADKTAESSKLEKKAKEPVSQSYTSKDRAKDVEGLSNLRAEIKELGDQKNALLADRFPGFEALVTSIEGGVNRHRTELEAAKELSTPLEIDLDAEHADMKDNTTQALETSRAGFNEVVNRAFQLVGSIYDFRLSSFGQHLEEGVTAVTTDEFGDARNNLQTSMLSTVSGLEKQVAQKKAEKEAAIEKAFDRVRILGQEVLLPLLKANGENGDSPLKVKKDLERILQKLERAADDKPTTKEKYSLITDFKSKFELQLVQHNEAMYKALTGNDLDSIYESDRKLKFDALRIAYDALMAQPCSYHTRMKAEQNMREITRTWLDKTELRYDGSVDHWLKKIGDLEKEANELNERAELLKSEHEKLDNAAKDYRNEGLEFRNRMGKLTSPELFAMPGVSSICFGDLREAVKDRVREFVKSGKSSDLSKVPVNDFGRVKHMSLSARKDIKDFVNTQEDAWYKTARATGGLEHTFFFSVGENRNTAALLLDDFKDNPKVVVEHDPTFSMLSLFPGKEDFFKYIKDILTSTVGQVEKRVVPLRGGEVAALLGEVKGIEKKNHTLELSVIQEPDPAKKTGGYRLILNALFDDSYLDEIATQFNARKEKEATPTRGFFVSSGPKALSDEERIEAIIADRLEKVHPAIAIKAADGSEIKKALGELILMEVKMLAQARKGQARI